MEVWWRSLFFLRNEWESWFFFVVIFKVHIGEGQREKCSSNGFILFSPQPQCVQEIFIATHTRTHVWVIWAIAMTSYDCTINTLFKCHTVNHISNTFLSFVSVKKTKIIHFGDAFAFPSFFGFNFNEPDLFCLRFDFTKFYSNQHFANPLPGHGLQKRRKKSNKLKPILRHLGWSCIIWLHKLRTEFNGISQ